MIGLPAGTRILLVAGVTDMRKGFDGLSALVQTALNDDPFSGQLFVFRGRRCERVELLWWDGQGLCLYYKRIETGKFVWPRAEQGRVHLTPAELSMLLEGINWRWGHTATSATSMTSVMPGGTGSRWKKACR